MRGPALAMLLVATCAWAQGWEGDQESLPVPPTAAARQSDASRALIATTPVERLKATSFRDASGVLVTARVARPGTGEALLWELRWEPGDSWGPGTWVAFRDGLGEVREVRVILREGTDDQDHKVAQTGTWIRLVPQGKGRGCRLDLFLAGRLVTGGWTVSAPLLDVLDADDDWLWQATAADLDWGALLPSHRWEDDKVVELQTRLHKLLSTVPTAPSTLWWPDPQSSATGTAPNGSPWGAWTGLPGREGHPTRGLGPWGVTHWVASGVLRGWKAPYPTWDALLASRATLPGYSRALVPDDLTQDPAFALDWIRNLGLEAYRALYPRRPLTDDAADVKGLPYLEPLPVSGYAVDDLPALLHLLAVHRPGTAYLVSLNWQQTVQGGASSLAFREPAVLLPWVGEDGHVRVAVYDGPQEKTLEQWLGAVSSVRKGARPDHVAVVALPLPATVPLPVLPAR